MKLITFIVFFLLVACDPSTPEKSTTGAGMSATESHKILSRTSPDSRWFSQPQLQLGGRVYQSNCLDCHKQHATGTSEWKKTLANGDYPPPPLNGSAHAWHHDIGTLIRSVKTGGEPLGGVMPGFENKLSDKEILAVIAYFQSYWSNEIYNAWLENGGLEAE